ncbi:TPA: hypothetical protein PTV88_001580 [Cronobacter sakazakii]|nr:hypothetical protein [Cronobacter sakazakii]
MKNLKYLGDTPPEIETQELTWPLVFSVAGLTLLKSKSVMCQTLGASLTTLSLIKLIKKLATLA